MACPARRIDEEVCRRSFDPELNSFVQSYGTKVLDASFLLTRRGNPARRIRASGSVVAIEARLLRDGFVARYDPASAADGLPGGEGAFLACSFWLADNYVLQDRRDDARALFERLLSLRNDVGLLAEEYDPQARRQVGTSRRPSPMSRWSTPLAT